MHYLLTALVFFCGSHFALASPSDDLSASEQAYLRGDYGESLKVFNRLNDTAFEDTKPQAKYFLLCARLKSIQDDLAAAKECLRQAMQRDPGLTLDPYVDRPSLISVWRELQNESVASAAPHRAKPGAFKQNVRSIFSLAPFGIGSFVNDQYIEGTVFASLNVIAIASCAGSGSCVVPALVIPGLWGYELNENFPHFASTFPRTAGVLHQFIPIFPFGAAQFRNGHPTKASALAIVQLTSLVLLENKKPSVVTAGGLGFAISYVYGLFDGWYNTPNEIESPGLMNSLKMRVSPWFSDERQPGVAVAWQW